MAGRGGADRNGERTMSDVRLTPGIQYLHDRIRDADQKVALLLEQVDALHKRNAELEKNQKKPRKE